MLRNKEIVRALWLLTALSALLTALSALVLGWQAWVVGASCAVLTGAHLLITARRYRRLAQLSEALDALLTQGTPLSIDHYTEGELSILSSQIQKITLRLMEAADAVRADKALLADALADISHQLRTPLTAMGLTITMLRGDNLSDQRRNELTGELRGLLARMQWLIETLLKLSRLDAGTVTMASQPVAVEELFTLAAAPLAIPMELRNQTLRLSHNGETFRGDLTWMAEALTNLLKNAMEHTPEGGTITLSADRTPLYTRITVADAGPGFAKADLPHLFERFYRGSGSSGYGIGLSLARTIITAHNGTVQASNGPAGGVITIRLYTR